MTLQLMDFQKEAKYKILASERLRYLWWSCGLGKTYMMADILENWRIEDRPDIFVTRKIAKTNIANVFKQYTSLQVITWNSKKDVHLLKKPFDILVIHPEALTRNDAIYPFKWGHVIMDESHRIKNYMTNISREMFRLDGAESWCLSATPTHKRYYSEVDNFIYPNPIELHNQLRFLHPESFKAAKRFRNMFCQYKTKDGYPVVVGIKDAMREQYKAILDKYMNRISREDLGEVPPTVSPILIQLEKRQRKLYDEMEARAKKDILVDLTDIGFDVYLILNALSKNTKLQRVTSDPRYFGRNVGSAKEEFVLDYLKDNDSTFLILTAFVDSAIAIYEKIVKLESSRKGFDRKVQIYTGERNNLNVNDKPDIIVGTIQSFSGAVDLPWVNNLIFMDMIWSSINMTQARDRIIRGLHQSSHKNLMYLIGEYTIDELLFDSVLNSFDELRVRNKIMEWLGVVTK